jgi:LCP family protein required for cell wall assembly
MRTTLKRGIGQAAGANGNGHSVVPPLFGPVARYKQPDGPRRSVMGWILRIFGWLVLALLVVGAGIAGGAYLYAHESIAQVVNVTGKVQKADVNLTLPGPSGAATALVAGYDVRSKSSGKDPYAGSNSDTLMLLRADPANNTLSLLSFPRDLYVKIYCHGDAYDTTDRINSAWSHCSNGPAGTLDTIEHLAPALKINYLITLDFHAFKQLVNQLHGVYMNVDRRYYNPHGTGYSYINLQPGYQKLTGGAALSYVRYRHTDSDIYRTGRQQLFIEALKSRLRSALSLTSLPSEVPKLIHVLKSNIEVGTANHSPVDLGLLGKYLNLIYGLPSGHLLRNQIPLSDFTYPTIGGASVTTAPQSAINQAVNSFLHPDVRESSAVGAQYGAKTDTPKKKKTKVHKLAKQDISVLVLNAGRTPGEAADTSYRLTTHGYTTKTLPSGDQANAPKVETYSTVFYDSVQPNAEQAAQQIAPLFGKQTKVKPMTTAISGFAQQAGNPMTVVTVGTKYPGHLVIAKPPKVTPKQPPQVTDGAAMTAPRLRSVYDKVHFPLMVPHKIAQGFVLNSDEGVRGFKPIGHQHEVVLSFGQPYGLEYFQVEETTWNSAPLFANPSFTLVHKGQKFNVYTTGGQIQMVALRTPRATYWVSNTILNELSNSTMIAIAESLRPLRR